MINKKCAFKILSILLIIGIMASGCANTTVLQTNPSDASVYLKGEKVGTTPYTHKDRKIAGASTLITFKKEGYEDYSTTLRKVEKWNIGALVAGLFFIYPLFWILGYDEEHTYDLFEATIPVEVEPEAEAEDQTIKVKIDESDLVKADNIVKNKRVERLLAEGRIERAVEYSEDQEGEKQDECFYTLAEYYLGKNNIPLAEEYFQRSGKTGIGNIRISEVLMRGIIIDSVLVIDTRKARPYLEKIYNDEDIIEKHMAVSYEKFAMEQMNRIRLLKSMKDAGISYISNGDTGTNIDMAYGVARIITEIYLNDAIQSYNKLEYYDKARELENTLEVFVDEFPMDGENDELLKTKISISK
jgi:hypothetical protein